MRASLRPRLAYLILPAAVDSLLLSRPLSGRCSRGRGLRVIDRRAATAAILNAATAASLRPLPPTAGNETVGEAMAPNVLITKWLRWLLMIDYDYRSIQHPGWDSNSLDNDIAIVKLSRSVSYSRNIR